MKKTTIAVAVIVVVIVAAGLFLLSRKSSQQAPAGQAGQMQTQTQNQQSPAGSAINSIKDAMGLGTQMKCTYSTTASDGSTFQSVAYVEGQKYKSTATVAGKTMDTLFDGENMYIWTDGQTTGMKMAISCINDLKASLPQNQQNNPAAGVQSPEDQFKNATNTSCSPASGTDFSVPAGVTFTDECGALENSLNSVKNIQNKLPANMPNLPTGVNIPKY
jgi:hypothetical protein